MNVIEKAQQRMTDYTKLVEALRCRATRDWTNCGNCKYADEDDDPRGCWGTKICADAADAIEALRAEVERLQADVEKWTFNATLEQSKAIANFESYCKLKAQLPKRGEIVRCKECIHFTQSGWCDREFDWFPVDRNDFCSMAEKMEVQE